jgi:hypothetical protein
MRGEKESNAKHGVCLLLSDFGFSNMHHSVQKCSSNQLTLGKTTVQFIKTKENVEDN